MAAKAKARVQVKVKWRRGGSRGGMWSVEGTGLAVPTIRNTKSEALQVAIRICRKIARDGGRAELTVYNRNGRIAGGNGARRTYPRSSDPWRHKG